MALITVVEPPAYAPALAPASTSASDPHHQYQYQHQHPHPYCHHLVRPVSSTPPPAYTERSAIKLRITSAPGAGILNASILTVTGRPLYTVSSDAKLKKTSVRRRVGRPRSSSSNNDVDWDATAAMAGFVELEEVARFKWDRASPRVRFCSASAGAGAGAGGSEGDKKKRKRKLKVKCKEWLPLAAGPASGTASDLQSSRVFTLNGARYSITERKGGIGYLLRIDEEGTSPLLPLARWRTAPDARWQGLEVFDDACAIPGLFDAFVLALIVSQSGQPLGDVPDCLNSASPKFYGNGDLMWR